MKNYPCIRTKLPGPNAVQYLEKEKNFVSPSSTKSYPLVVKSAKGMTVTDVDDNIFLDFTAGVAVCNTGHNHDQIISSSTPDEALSLPFTMHSMEEPWGRFL